LNLEKNLAQQTNILNQLVSEIKLLRTNGQKKQGTRRQRVNEAPNEQSDEQSQGNQENQENQGSQGRLGNSQRIQNRRSARNNRS